MRADLLIKPGHARVDDLPDGVPPERPALSRRVTAIHSYSFEASCHTPDGSRRYVHAEWQPAEGSQFQGGLISVSA